MGLFRIIESLLSVRTGKRLGLSKFNKFGSFTELELKLYEELVVLLLFCDLFAAELGDESEGDGIREEAADNSSAEQ